MYSFDSRIRYSEVDQKCLLSLDKLIDYFQDCSTFHSDSVGYGVKATAAEQRCWMILNWYIEIERMPELGEAVTTVTWPYSFKSCRGGRSFGMKDKEGNWLAKADSHWVYIDVEKGGFATVPEEMGDRYGIEEILSVAVDTKKLRVPSDCQACEAIRVQKEHLDTNHHVNNGQYVRMALSQLAEDIDIAGVKVEYRKQAMLGDVIIPKVRVEKGTHLVALCDEDGKPYAMIEIRER